MNLAYLLPCVYVLMVPHAACTERSLEARPEAVPIRLYTGIRTRAAVDRFEDTPVCIAFGATPGSYTQCWDGVATNDEIILTPVRYYPQDGSRIYLRGFYPPAPLAADGTLKYSLTGEEDLMMTAEQSGTQEQPFTADEDKRLVHRHLLTKLNFSLKLDIPDPDKYSIRALSLNGLTQQVTLSLLTGQLDCDGSTRSVIVYESSEETGTYPFENGMAELPGYILVQPRAEFTIDLRLAVDDVPAHDRVYSGLPIHFEGGAGESGVAYTVTVDIPEPSVSDPEAVRVRATVSHWGGGNAGSGELVPQKKEGR